MKKILVIEDEAAVRENIIELLQNEGYLTLEARDGEEGLRVVWDDRPDLILCDIRMPRLDGYGVLARLNQDSSASAIPFIFLTARTERTDMRTGMNLGADDYITKPYALNDILDAVKRRLDKRDLLAHQAEVKREELQRKMTYSLPHELLTPLSVILSRSDLLVGDAEIIKDSGQVRGMGKDIRDAAGRLLRLIQDYLDYAELELLEKDDEQKKKLQAQTVEFPERLILEIGESVSKEFFRFDDLRGSADSAVVLISENYLLRIAESLLENAFIQSPGGTQVEFKASVIPGQNYYVLRVKDEGRGFTVDEIALIKEQIPMSGRKYELQGTVIKLMFVNKMVHFFNGRLNIQSIPGKGNIVDVYLPCRME